MISTVPVISGGFTLNPLAGLTPLGVFQIVRWLGGSRRTEDLVAGVSFPGYDAQGNWVGFPDYDEMYQYADVVREVPADLVVDAIRAGVNLIDSPKQGETAMQVLRLIIPTAPGRVDTGATYPGCSIDNTQACDPRQFSTVTEAAQYAEQHGEIPQVVTSAEQAWQVNAQQQKLISNQGAAIQTTSQPTGLGPASGARMPVYRLLIGTGPVDSGATYPGCALDNPGSCQPRQFANLADAVEYAYQHSELPVQVGSTEEAWAIAAGTATVDPSRVIPRQSASEGSLAFAGVSGGVILAAVGAYLLLRK